MAARVDQDISLIAVQSTGSKARVDQDISLIAIQYTGSKARVNQDISLIAVATSPFPFPMLPIQIVGQNTIKPAQPIRGPEWDVKTISGWNSVRQQTVSGKTVVIKRQQNRSLQWEFTFSYLNDNPNSPNGYYTVPISATDMEILQGFFSSVQGTGNFAYRPPDTAHGGVFGIIGVSAFVANQAVITTDGVVPVTQARLGDSVFISGLTTNTYLNGQNGVVVAVSVTLNKITLAIPTSGVHAFASDSGTMLVGQLLSPVDSNLRTQLVNSIGAYPNSISPGTTSTSVTDPVQMIDVETLSVYANGVSAIFGTKNTTRLNRALFVKSSPDVSPYQGIVLQFLTTPATPLIAMFNYYYICRFTEDTQDYKNFLTMLWACSSVKIEQVRQ